MSLLGVPLSSVIPVIVSGVEPGVVTRYVHVIAEPTASTGPVGESASSAAVGCSGSTALIAFLIRIVPTPVPVTRFTAASATVVPLTQPGTPVETQRAWTVTVLATVPTGAVLIAPATPSDVKTHTSPTSSRPLPFVSPVT